MQRHKVRWWRIGWTCSSAQESVAGMLKPGGFDRFVGRKFPADLVDLQIRCDGCFGCDLDAAFCARPILFGSFLLLIGRLRAAVLAAAAENRRGAVDARTIGHHHRSLQRTAAEGNPAGDQDRRDSMCEAGPVHGDSFVERIDILLYVRISLEYPRANQGRGYSDETD